MSYLSVDNLIGVSSGTGSPTSIIECKELDVYNGATNFTRITSASSAAPRILVLPDLDGDFVVTNGNQTLSNKTNHQSQGSATNPSYAFQGDTDTGMYRAGSNTIGFATSGSERLTINTTDVSINLLPLYVENYKSNNIGSSGNTVYGSLTNDLGMYFDLNRINFSTNSVERLNIQNTAITSFVKVLLPDSGVGFSNSPTTMIQYNPPNRIGMYCNNSLILQLTPTALDCRQPINLFNLGTAAAPQIFNTTHSTTGLYWSAGPILNVAVGGVQKVGFESTGIRLYNSSPVGYTPSILGIYHEVNQSCTLTNGNNTQTLTLRFTRIGRICNITIPYFATTNTNGSTSTVAISFSTISSIYNCDTPGGYGIYFSLGVGYVASTRVYLTAQLQGTNIYFFNQANTTLNNNTQYEHLGSSIQYVSSS